MHEAPRRRGARASSTSSWPTAAPCAPSAPAPPRTGEPPDFVPLVRAWGGVTLAYRKRLQDAPAYRLNHEEVEKALEEGIAFAEGLDPVEALPDALRPRRGDGVHHHASTASTTRVELPARTVLVAAGTAPNVTYEKEHPGTFELDGKARFFKGFRAVRPAPERLAARGRPERLLHLLRPRRPLRQLLRRQPPALRRQRGQGHGLGQARLSARGRALRRRAGGARSGGAAGARRALAGAGRAARRRAAGAGRAGRPADADDHRGRRAGAGRGAALPARASSTGCRTSSAAASACAPTITSRRC